VTEAITVEAMTKLLSRFPSASWCCRVELPSLKSTWLYVDEKSAEMYDLPLEALRLDPGTVMERILPEDRASVEAVIGQGFKSLAPIVSCSRLVRRTGEVRWIETHILMERDSTGARVLYGQLFDVTERKRLEQALADSEAARRKADVLHRAVIDAIPIGVMVANQAHELLIFNPAQQRMNGGAIEHTDGNVTGAYGVFMADGVTPLSMEDSGMARGLRGETLEEEVVLRNPRLANEARMHVSWTPLRDESGQVYASLGVSLDITMQRALELELRARNEQLATSEDAKTVLIDRLRYSIDELSNPILEVWDDVLVMPIIGVVDSRRTSDMVQRLLTEVTRSQASFVIIDLTGVEIVDTKTADHLMKLMRKVEVVGARCVLTGIRSAVAETLVDIGVDFDRITTLRNLKHGLREAMRFARSGREDSRRELELDDGPADDEKPRGRARG
jgi:rsbT co-antagonist protein RsbR